MGVNRVYYYQGDRRPYFRLGLTRSGKPIDISTASGVTFYMYSDPKDATTLKATGPCAVIDDVGGVVEYVWNGTDLDTPGDYWAVFVIDWGGEPEGVPDQGYISVVVHPRPTP